MRRKWRSEIRLEERTEARVVYRETQGIAQATLLIACAVTAIVVMVIEGFGFWGLLAGLVSLVCIATLPYFMVESTISLSRADQTLRVRRRVSLLGWEHRYPLAEIRSVKTEDLEDASKLCIVCEKVHDLTFGLDHWRSDLMTIRRDLSVAIHAMRNSRRLERNKPPPVAPRPTLKRRPPLRRKKRKTAG
ncbi:MAG: hypothetical protein U0Q16_03685 [Bryobacteraceae bacterium]